MEPPQKGHGRTVMTRATLEPFLGKSIALASLHKLPLRARMAGQ